MIDYPQVTPQIATVKDVQVSAQERTAYENQIKQLETDRQQALQQLIQLEQTALTKEQQYQNQTSDMQAQILQERQSFAAQQKVYQDKITALEGEKAALMKANTDAANKYSQDLNAAKNEAKAATDAANKAVTDLAALNKDYTDQKRISGTSKQTINQKMQVLIPHGIPINAVKPGSKRVAKLNAVTEAAAGYRSASVDDTNIIIDYDVALVTETDGWVMQWEL